MTIRYMPKEMKLFFAIKRIRNRIAKMATTNETAKPTSNRVISLCRITSRLSKASSPAAPRIVGTASMNEKRTIVSRGIPRARPPIILAAERETPGITASVWKIPTVKASRYVISRTFSLAISGPL